MEITPETKRALQIAQSIAKENNHSVFGSAHLLKALLHKDIGLWEKISSWDEDIYYIEEWAEVRIESYPKDKISSVIKGDESISQIFNEAENISIKLGQEFIDPISILASLSTPGVGFNYEQLKTFPLSQETILTKTQETNTFNKIIGKEPQGIPNHKMPSGNLLLYCHDLIEENHRETIDVFLGRKQELISMAEILCRKSKPNVIITGDSGVGKTALARGLAQAIAKENVPQSLKNAKIFSLDCNALLAGASYKGEAEDRFRGIIKDLTRLDTPILFIDDIHQLFDKTAGLQGIVNIIKGELAKKSFFLIGTALTDEYRKKLEPETSLIRWCEVLPIVEPSIEESTEIVTGVVSAYVHHHQVSLENGTIEETVKLSQRYIKERNLPDSAIDVLDRTMAAVQFMYSMSPSIAADFSKELQALQASNPDPAAFEKLYNDLANSLNFITLAYVDEDRESQSSEKKAITAERIEAVIEKLSSLKESANAQVSIAHVASTISKICGIPVGKILSGERERLIKMEEHLQQKVIGQDQAVKVLADAILESRSGLSRPGQPIGSFFLMGPTGTGKTELAKQLADFLFQSSSALIRFDMSEFKEEHSAALLYGAPPGYVGYEEGGLLVNKIRQQPYSVVLFDEIEKAHPSVFDIFLQILDEGKIHDKLGRQGDFSNAVILFTSNIGSRHIVEMINKKGELPSQIEMSNEMSHHFRPEFLGRLSGIVPFAPIKKEHVLKILQLQLVELEEALSNQGIKLEITDAAAEQLAANGYSQEYGARPLRSVIRTNLKTPLSRMIISSLIGPTDLVRADINSKGEITLGTQPDKKSNGAIKNAINIKEKEYTQV